jgi:radical SAM superfamily enzyme YgiQ (UPF0313 family)
VKKSMDDILLKVQKPARYTGNELNMTIKKDDGIRVRFAMCFPDIYEIGMSHLGIRILYHVINGIEGAYCERAFSPWIDMEAELIANDIPLTTLETKRPLSEFDFVGFTLQYEMSYTNILNMLKLSGIPLVSNERTDSDPLVIAGGPCAYDPEPLADFIDFFVIGESEEAIAEIIRAYDAHKSSGKGRRSFLDHADDIEGIYVPGNKKKTVKRRIIRDLDLMDYPAGPLVPYLEIVHDRAFLEIFRGCVHGCRFCQAGYVYRPVREKSVQTLLRQAEEIISSTGYEEISLCSLSTGDYTGIRDLTAGLLDILKKKRVNLSLPSLRVDSFSLDLLKKVQNDRKSGLTFAPEAGTKRLRAVINKGISEEDVLSSVSLAFGNGYRTIKLYFMLGLPDETQDDVAGIADLVEKIINKYVEINGRKNGLLINVGTALFVPKPFTPFQWEKQATKDEYMEKVGYLRKKFDKKIVDYKWHDYETSFLEALLARGDRRLGKVILNVFNKGSRFDAWNDYFDFEKWMTACREEGIDPHHYVNEERDISDELPWDFIDIGITRDFFVSERKKAYEGAQTADCREGCADCGLLGLGLGACVK